MTPQLQDLGRRAVACKGWRWMEGYAQCGSHMYLAATEEALRWQGRSSQSEVLADLTARGLPKAWGVLRFWQTQERWVLSPVRHCRGGGTLFPTNDRLHAALARLAQSLSYRACFGGSDA